jgi:RND family efflux transporter MFP subunit
MCIQVKTRLAKPMRAVTMLLLATALAACSGKDATPTPAAITGVETIVVGESQASGGRSWDGVVEAVKQAALSAQTNGRVTQVNHDVNDRVAAGTVLLRLSAVEQQAGADTARAQLRAAEAAANEASSNYQRFAKLGDGQYVSKAQIDQARAARDSAVAARDAARAQLAQAGQQTDYTVVRAPYAGIVSTRDVEPGESVAPGQLLMTVFAPDALRIEVRVPQAEADLIRAQPLARVVFDDGRRIEVSDVVVFPAADAGTHTVPVRIQLPALYPPPLPGSTARVVFPGVKGAAHPRIPVSALVRRGEINGAYVLAEGRLGLRQLRLGETLGDEVEVISGLKAGERIATDPVRAAQVLVKARKNSGATR